jgi:DNA-binding NarL/FixJ family response regulator
MRVVIAEDSALLREGLVRVLGARGFDVVGHAANAADLLRKVGALRPDVAITDIRMPPTQTDEGLVAAEQIARSHPDVGVLVLSQHLDAGYAMRLLAVRNDRVGYLLKDRIAEVDVLAEAVRRIGRGGSAVDPAVVAQLLGRRHAAVPLEELTAREREILGLMAEGHSNASIAAAVYVTVKTVETHVNHIFTKLGLPPAQETNRRVLAVLTYLRAER